MTQTVDQIKGLAGKRIEELQNELVQIDEQKRQLAKRAAEVQGELDALSNIDAVMSGKYRPGAASPRGRRAAAGKAPRAAREGSVKGRILEAIRNGVATTDALVSHLGVDAKALYNAVAQLKREGRISSGSKRGEYRAA